MLYTFLHSPRLIALTLTICALSWPSEALGARNIHPRNLTGMRPPEVARADSTDKVDLKQNAYQLLIETYYRSLSDSDTIGAENCIRQAVELLPNHPTNALLMTNLAQLHLCQGDSTTALEDYTKALQMQPEQPTIREQKALLLAAMHRDEEALLEYNYIIAVRPRDEVYRYRRAMVFVGLHRYAEAEADLEYILTRNQASLKARQGLALVATLQGRYTDAERLYDYLIEKLPERAEMYEGRARMFFLNGMQGFALRDINKAIRLAAAVPEYYRLRAAIHTELGDDKSARRDLEFIKCAN